MAKLEEIDSYLPPSQSFFIFINTASSSYEFVSKNFEYSLGYNREEMLKYGAKFWISCLHPEDCENWLKSSQDMMDFTLSKVNLADRKKLVYSYNFRVKTAQGSYVQIVASLTPTHFDEKGKPILGLAHYTIVETEGQSSSCGVKILDENNRYKTLFYKNYFHESLFSKLSQRQVEIVKLLADGKKSKEIAKEIFLSNHTVDGHRRNILKKLGFRSTDELIQHLKSHELNEKHSI
ncbi:LuxR C-terminal-related transcriptional regulator [Namhaeicola litoreus]|uniref:LuxR C-terminal-related transcriptional regulator n=1 Tax=Namhaeicola litoreus TaxID=1052145 RepID=UPI00366B6766